MKGVIKSRWEKNLFFFDIDESDIPCKKQVPTIWSPSRQSPVELAIWQIRLKSGHTTGCHAHACVGMAYFFYETSKLKTIFSKFTCFSTRQIPILIRNFAFRVHPQFRVHPHYCLPRILSPPRRRGSIDAAEARVVLDSAPSREW